MRSAVLFFSLAILSAKAQIIVPAFNSELVEPIYIDKELNGTPSEYQIKTYFYNKDSAKLIGSPLERNYYLENGQVLAMEVTRKDRPYKFYQIDFNGRLVEYSEMDRDSNTPRIEYEYDDTALTASKIVYRRNETIHSKTVIRYNESLQIIAREEYSGGSKLDRFWKYYYNENQDLLSDQYFDGPSSVSPSIQDENSASDSTYYTYDYYGDQKKSKRYAYQNEVLKSKRLYEYYPDSMVTKTTFYQFNGVPNEQQIKIEQDSLRIEVRGFLNQMDTTQYRSRFMEIYLNGDLIEYERRTLQGTYVDRFATFYEYDELGNWIKKMPHSNGVIIKQEERIILY